MLIFYDPSTPPPWTIHQVIDDHPECVYVTREGVLFDLRQPGLQCVELDAAATAAIRPYRNVLHSCTIEIADGLPVLNLPADAPPEPRGMMMNVPPGIRHRAWELAQMRHPMDDSGPIRVDAERVRRR